MFYDKTLTVMDSIDVVGGPSDYGSLFVDDPDYTQPFADLAINGSANQSYVSLFPSYQKRETLSIVCLLYHSGRDYFGQTRREEW